MHVFHAHWHPASSPQDEAGLFLWAESSELTQQKKGGGRGASLHPFNAAAATVAQLLETLVPHLADYPSKRLNLLLPTTEAGPRPSPHLVTEWEVEAESPPAFAPWRLVGLWLSPVEAFALLAGLPGPDDLPPGLALGNDVRYWQTVTGLVLETLAQQKLLPFLVRGTPTGKAFQARWLPVLDGSQDGPRLGRLLEAMPPLCRAEAKSAEEAFSPRLLLETFINTTIDAVARQWAYPHRPAFPHSHEVTHHWLTALFTPEAGVAGSAAQLEDLAKSYEVWLRNLYVAGDKTFRIAFRLEAPAQQAEAKSKKDWQLHYLLQARDDPSLLVPAPQVWQAKGRVLSTLNRHFEQPQEKLLAGLGYAARLFPPLQAGLKTAKPASLPLSGQEAFQFLRETAPLLEASGFGVLVPPWWNKPGSRLGVRLKLGSTRKGPGADAIPQGKVSFENLIRYQWQLSVGDTTLTKEEFDALVALKSPLVQIRGQWVQLDPEQIEAAIRFWEKQDLEDEVGIQEALQMGLGAAETAGGLPVEGVDFEGWLREWMNRLTGGEKLQELPQPQGLQATLRPYQQYGFSWLNFLRQWGLGACLADDMGLGKTIQTLAMLLHEKEKSGSLPGPVLLICPTSVVSNWNREVRRFAPALSTLMHQGGDRLREEAFIQRAKTSDMVLTSYALVRRDIETLKQIDWFGVVLDEAQNIKNPETKQTRAIRQLPAGFRVALTGTPVENRLSELWSIMHFLNPGYLSSRKNFRQHFAAPIERYKDEKATGQLRKMVMPFILRRVKTDPSVIQDLPDKLEMKTYCTLSEEQATLYESVVQTSMQEVAEASGIQRRGLVLSMLMKLKQICNHPAQFLHQINESAGYDPEREIERSGKLSRLVEMLEEAVSVGDRVLIFTQFAEMGHMLKAQLQQQLGLSTLFLHGGTPAEKRTVMVRRFQEDPTGPPVFILSLKAGGTGLNLTRASHVFHFDRWWNPAVENQATDRAYRIGQKQNVQVHKFVCAGTIEEMVDEMIEGKKSLAEAVVGGGENWLTELSTEDLKELVTLRREVMA